MSDYIAHTKQWLADFVIGLNLCPFAQKPFSRDKIKYVLFEANDEQALMQLFLEEAFSLSRSLPEEIETSLIIHPNCLSDFSSYLNFIQVLENLLVQGGLEGILQIASFHPDYQFAETKPEDVENYTNRSPYPMIHLLREESIEKALEHFDHSKGTMMLSFPSIIPA